MSAFHIDDMSFLMMSNEGNWEDGFWNSKSTLTWFDYDSKLIWAIWINGELFNKAFAVTKTEIEIDRWIGMKIVLNDQYSTYINSFLEVNYTTGDIISHYEEGLIISGGISSANQSFWLSGYQISSK